MATPVVMPKQGNTVEECLLTEWKVSVGDNVKEGDVIAGIETDKATFELEATATGTVLALFWGEGDLVPVLQNICVIGSEGEDISSYRPDGSNVEAAAGPEPAAADAAAADVAVSATPAADSPVAGNAPMSPRARKFLAEHPFVVPANLAGSGAGGRVIEQDLKTAFATAPRLTPTAAAMRDAGVAVPASGSGAGGAIRAADMGTQKAPAVPAPAAAAPAAPVSPAAPAPASGVEEVRLTNIRKIIASRLHDSLSSMAQYTLNAEADVSGLLALRKRIKANAENLSLANVNIGDMVMYAAVKALQKHPDLNAEFDGTTLRRYTAVNMGFACDTARGLMVPVVHNAETLSLGALAARSKELATQANAGSLSPDFLTGATFTVSNLGTFGVTTFTPVVNAPQIGILGVGTTILRPVRAGDGIVYRDFMQFSLTLNHMIVDGAPGARFLQTLTRILENFELVCIAG